MAEGDEALWLDGIEYVLTDDDAPWCDGGGGALGHPREFMIFDGHHQILICGYCSRRFVHRSNPEADALRRLAAVVA